MSIFEASEKYIAERRSAHDPCGQGVRFGIVARLGCEGPASCLACAPSLRKVTSASIARIWWAWAFCRCNFSMARLRNRWDLTGEEVFEISGIRELIGSFAPGRKVKVRATANGKTKEFNALVRIDTPQEAQYYANGGILQYVLRQLLSTKPAAVHA